MRLIPNQRSTRHALFLLSASLLLLVNRNLARATCFVATGQRLASRKKQPDGNDRLKLLSTSTDDVFVVSFDGAVADTSMWRVHQGVTAALGTWPELQELTSNQNLDWLYNKLGALSHTLQSRPGSSLACEYSLLTRLFLEEQELDRGGSVGRTGKYASKFHPSSTNQTSIRKSRQGSRPLTVGEVAANWHDGGFLYESLPARYNIEGRDPMPNLQRVANQKDQDEKNPGLPVVHAVVADAIHKCKGTTIITVGHDSDLEVATRCLDSVGIHAQTLSSVDQARVGSMAAAGSVYLFPHCTTEKSELKTLKKLVEGLADNREKETNVFVVNSCWHSLQQLKIIFGDNMPRKRRGSIPSSFARIESLAGVNLSLNLPLWAYNTDEIQHNQAEMDPWTNLLQLEGFVDLLSARVTAQS